MFKNILSLLSKKERDILNFTQQHGWQRSKTHPYCMSVCLLATEHSKMLLVKPGHCSLAAFHKFSAGPNVHFIYNNFEFPHQVQSLTVVC